MVGADPEGACVYADESWFVGKAYGGRCWGDRGKPTWIPAFGPKQGQALYLGLDVASGEVLWRYSRSTTAVASTQYLSYLVQQYAGRKYVAVVWDNASWHKAVHVQRWLDDHNATAVEKQRPKVFVSFLPTYSPWLNPVEAVINQTKRRVLFGRNIDEPAERRRALDTHFAQRNARMAAAQNSNTTCARKH